MRQWAKNTRLMDELICLKKVLAQDVLFFKGPLLAYRLYGPLDARAISDLDLLVPPSRISRERPRIAFRGVVRFTCPLLAIRVSQWFTYHFEYRRNKELHWNSTGNSNSILPCKLIWTRFGRAANHHRRKRGFYHSCTAR